MCGSIVVDIEVMNVVQHSTETVVIFYGGMSHGLMIAKYLMAGVRDGHKYKSFLQEWCNINKVQCTVGGCSSQGQAAAQSSTENERSRSFLEMTLGESLDVFGRLWLVEGHECSPVELVNS